MTKPSAIRPATAAAPPHAILLAAGMGKRMGGDLPKVLFPVADRPMIHWVVRACHEAGVQRVVVVIGYKGDLVREALAGTPGVVFVEQTEQLGTAHAAKMAQPLFENQPDLDVFVLAGDGPLIRGRTLIRLLELHRRNGAAATLATAEIDNPTGYGRIIRTADGGFEAIVEEKDATPRQRAIREVNPSYYCFDARALFTTLARVTPNAASGEYYVTDVPALLLADGERVEVIDAVPPEDVLSINTPEQLAAVDAIFRSRSVKTAGTGAKP